MINLAIIRSQSSRKSLRDKRLACIVTRMIPRKTLNRTNFRVTWTFAILRCIYKSGLWKLSKKYKTLFISLVILNRCISINFFFWRGEVVWKNRDADANFCKERKNICRTFGELYGQIFMTHYITLKFARSGATMTWPIPAVAIEAYASRDSKEIKDFPDISSLMRNDDFSWFTRSFLTPTRGDWDLIVRIEYLSWYDELGTWANKEKIENGNVNWTLDNWNPNLEKTNSNKL